MICSLIIPAHNEEAIIARLLSRFAGSEAGEAFEVVVVCNGCTDGTAEIARTVLPNAIVVETDIASKSLALNLGNEHASGDIRFYADADLEFAPEALLAVARAMRAHGYLIAAPRMEISLAGASSAVARFYDVWRQLPYFTENMVGPALYGLSAEGRERLGALPRIIADDEYVRRAFAPEERHCIAEDERGNPALFTVHAPHDLASLIRVKARQHAGVIELDRKYPAPRQKGASSMGVLGRLVFGGKVSPLAAATYGAVKIAARLRYLWDAAQGKSDVWLRDNSARNTIGNTNGPRTR